MLGLQYLRLVCLFPRQIEVRPAEMPVGRNLPVDRAAQVQIADNGGRPQIEMLFDEGREPVVETKWGRFIFVCEPKRLKF
jgi:hypothetical protein